MPVVLYSQTVVVRRKPLQSNVGVLFTLSWFIRMITTVLICQICCVITNTQETMCKSPPPGYNFLIFSSECEGTETAEGLF